MEVIVCKHFQNGFCKFGDSCRRQHISDKCLKPSCKTKTCSKRNPRVCKYLKNHNTCKFGEHCAYEHILDKDTVIILELVNKVKTLENTVKTMSEQIHTLKSKLEVKVTENQQLSSQNIVCDQCDYKASNTTVLKRHKTLKHKELTPEKLRDSAADCSLQTSPTHKVREEPDESFSELHLAPSIPKNKCGSRQWCTNVASNCFSSTYIFKIKYNNTFVFDACKRFIPLTELRKSPPLKV